MNPHDWLEKARKENFAIPALNAGTFETIKGIVEAAVEARSPVIIETSTGETKWMEAENVLCICRNYSDKNKVPVIVNLDHAYTEEDLKPGFEAGYDLIHFDGSKLPYEQNVEICKKIVPEAHKNGQLVEGEIDKILGEGSEVHTGQVDQAAIEAGKSKPETAAKFVSESGVDVFASFFGNVHGIYPGYTPHLDIELLHKIQQAIPNTFLSMHGSSGTPDDQVRAAVAAEVVKVNVNTELRLAYRKGLEGSLAEHKEIAMYKVFPGVVEAVKKEALRWIALCGSGGKA
ncbi:MAG TPA: class II fructose-bisphosphate aldolase [Candidatus Saccharimonadales bacterium]|nr:class II fructose-bisphosphate aldolase [Candidatus Saccharimonadales bacterium]